MAVGMGWVVRWVWDSKGTGRCCLHVMVPTPTGKPGKMGEHSTVWEF